MKNRYGLLSVIGKSLDMPVFKIVYRSRALWHADHSENEADIARIITAARAYNSAHGITGALLISSYGYAQVLEGPAAAVKSLFGRISADPRHDKVELLYSQHHADRDFGNWAMAVVSPSGNSDTELACTSYRFDVEVPDNGDDIRMMLRQILAGKSVSRNPVLH
jgi:hypothetical protein